MLNKSINLQKTVMSPGGTAIAFFNSQVSVDCSGLNFSVQIIDKDALESNKEMLKNEYYEFLENVHVEAINNGWTILEKEDEITE